MATTRQKLKDVLKDLLTPGQVRAGLGVSQMTLHDWRKRRGLPHVSIPGDARHSVRFIKSEVRDWAKRSGVKFHTSAR